MGAYGYRGTILNSVRGDTLTSEYQKNEHFRNWKCSFFDVFRLLIFIFVWQDQVQDDSCHG